MQPVELVALMAAIIYSGRSHTASEPSGILRSAVEEAWQLWHLAMDEWSDPGARRLDNHPPAF
jgi:hypothetical protein